VFDPVLFVFLNKPRNRVKILYQERNGFCLWLKGLESERFKTSPNCSDEAIVLTVQELNWLLDGQPKGDQPKAIKRGQIYLILMSLLLSCFVRRLLSD
jgi:hypothetical protein